MNKAEDAMGRPQEPGPGATRRGFLKTFGGAAFGGLVGTEAILLEPDWLDVTSHTIPVPGLSAGLEGISIAQISDLHFRGDSNLNKSLLKALAAKPPQVLVLSGDIIDNRLRLDGLKEFLAAINRDQTDIFACMGNWEHVAYFTPMSLAREYVSVGVKLLVGRETLSRGGLWVAATDDCYIRQGQHEQLVRSAGFKKGTRLLFTHSPSILDKFPPGDNVWDLALAGHTHGGQVNLGPIMFWLPPHSGRFVSGLYQTVSGPAYISRGVGTALLNVRFNCRPELAYFTLTRG